MDERSYKFETSPETMDIISYDRRLSRNSAALCSFIKQEAEDPPGLVLRCTGAHTSNKPAHDGESTSTFTRESFSFDIDLKPYIIHDPKPPTWIVEDTYPAFRGRFLKEIDERIGSEFAAEFRNANEPLKKFDRSIPGKDEQKNSELLHLLYSKHGHAPWEARFVNLKSAGACIESEDDLKRLQQNFQGLARSPRNLQDWAEEFCNRFYPMKEFIFEKKIYGWSQESLQLMMEKILKSKHVDLEGPVTIELITTGTKVIVRTDRWIWKIYEHWLFVIFTCIFIFFVSFLLDFQTKHYWFGGKWMVAGNAFALVEWDQFKNSHRGRRSDIYPKTKRKLTRNSDLNPTSIEVPQKEGITIEDFMAECEEQIAKNITGLNPPGRVLTKRACLAVRTSTDSSVQGENLELQVIPDMDIVAQHNDLVPVP